MRSKVSVYGRIKFDAALAVHIISRSKESVNVTMYTILCTCPLLHKATALS